jgi:hypothetical protein
MPLVDSGRAIGAVTQLLHDHLFDALGGAIDVTVGRPEPPASAPPGPRLNLFLYEIHLDEYLRNYSLDDGQEAPLWLVLHYLLTGFDRLGDSESIAAHEVLGQGMRALNGLNFLSLASLPAPTVAALNDNPDRLKVTFDPATSDLLGRLMQGSDEKYRCSAAFQVRPVMIAPSEPPSYNLLVGVDYTTAPPTVIGDAGVHNIVIPSIGPQITGIDPQSFGLGATVTLTGTGLDGSGLEVGLGPAVFGCTSQRADRLTFVVSPSLADGATMSAGSELIAVVQQLPFGKTRTSDPVIGGLQPRLDTAVPAGLLHTVPLDPTSPVYGTLNLTGALMGTAVDEIYVAFYQNGTVIAMYDAPVLAGGGPPFQVAMQVNIPFAGALPPGDYRIILRVNGQQAVTSPTVHWT